MTFDEKFIDKNIGYLSEEYDKICGQNKNIFRITADFIDGLKPVQRRALYIMSLTDQGKHFRKLASISGEVFGRVHPHAPAAIDEAIVNIEQPWHNNIPLITGDGNFGSVEGDPHGASRYIQAKLSDYAYACFFEDWSEAVVDMIPAYNNKDMEPVYLPAKYPNVFINGCLGIGYGQSCNIPPFNFKEVIDACIMLIMNPKARVILIPDSPTGADIVETDFVSLNERGLGSYTQRCKYEIDAEKNEIRIIAIPDQIKVVGENGIREKIADIKEKNGLPELVDMADLSGKEIDIRLRIREDVSPYKFMKKLLREVAGLEKTYPVNITIVDDYVSYDLNIRDLLLRWIRWRREQKRTVVNYKRTTILAEQRANEVKIFLMDKDHLDNTINIFKTSHNRAEIEHKLVERYRDSEIRMDSLQARALSNMRLLDLSIDAYNACLKKRDELAKELKEVEEILKSENGIDKLIIAELRDGAKRFGHPRRSNVVPAKISIDNQVDGECIVQLSSDGMIIRRMCTNVDEEPIPTDNNGFAVKVDNDSSFILIDERGFHSFIKVQELPIDTEVPVNRYSKQKTAGNIVAMLPVGIESEYCCTLISRKGQLKKIRISDMGPTKKPCIDLDKDDSLVRGIVTRAKSKKDLLVYTKNGMGQRFDPNLIRITSPSAKGGNGFKLKRDDEIVGCYAISPEENQYLLYVTTKGKMRLNLIDYLPTRDSKHDAMVSLINLNDRDRLLSIVGCNRLDKLQVFFDNGIKEVIDISKLEESTMSSEPKKVTSQNAVTTSIVKVKLM